MPESDPAFSDLLITVARVVVAAVLGYAGVRKLQSIRQFSRTVTGFPIIRKVFHSEQRALPFAFALSGLEVALGLLFGVGIQPAGITAVILGLLVSFSVGMLVGIVRGEEVKCGCFGSADRDTGWEGILRNLLLGALAVAGAQVTPISLDGYRRGAVAMTDLFGVLALAAQVLILGAAIAGHHRLRRAPGYVSHVPRPYSSIDTIWEGAPLR